MTSLVMVRCALEANAREGSMRLNGRTIFKSSHDLILIVGAMIALAMIVAKMVHNWRSLPASLGMNNAAMMVADSRNVLR